MNHVGFFKRIIVIIYDGLLMVAVTMVGYALLYTLMSLLPEGFDGSLVGSVIKISYLLGISFLFYGWFWTHGGQTLGMKVWNLYVVDERGKFLGWWQSGFRYLGAIVSWSALAGMLYYLGIERWYLAIGIGYSWSVIHPKRLAWHDQLSRSYIVQVPRTAKKDAQVAEAKS